MCSLIQKKLISIHKSLIGLLNLKDVQVSKIVHLRKEYCALQKISATLDSMLRFACLICMSKAVILCCLSCYYIVKFVRAGTVTGSGSFMDFGFNVGLISVLCVFGGRIVDSKSDILDALVCLGAKHASRKDEMGQELHYFLSLVGHSRMAMTIGNIFVLNKNIAVTIFGAISSYSIIIYQMS
ncbi:uncharacterized protein [Parasteatoda tepidariorum]|uniref:uncharacterized protein n=1 Tax=Parasteatoda tepidariorum TaxID=114398 RepID=UPI0039BD57EB